MIKSVKVGAEIVPDSDKFSEHQEKAPSEQLEVMNSQQIDVSALTMPRKSSNTKQAAEPSTSILFIFKYLNSRLCFMFLSLNYLQNEVYTKMQKN
jgi:hypothetical protein